MSLPQALKGSLEQELHRDSAENKLFIFNKGSALKKKYQEVKGHRAVGVVYQLSRDRGNYVPTILSDRYDAFLYLDKTTALHPLHFPPNGHLLPDTYPFGI